MFARIAAAKWETAVTSGVYNAIMEDFGENSHYFSYSRLNTFHGSTFVAVVTKRLFVGWYFRREKQQTTWNFEFTTGWEIKFGDGLTTKWWELCTERWSKFKNSVLCCWHHFLCRNCRSWGLVWKEFEARNRLENHFRRVSSALYGEGKRSEPRTWSGRMCLLVEGDQHHIKNSPQFWPVASKNNTTALQRLPQVLKVGPVYKWGL